MIAISYYSSSINITTSVTSWFYRQCKRRAIRLLFERLSTRSSQSRYFRCVSPPCCGQDRLASSSQGVLLSIYAINAIKPTIIVPENRKQNRLSLCGAETHTRLWILSFCSTEAEKTCNSHIALHRCRNCSPHRTRVTPKLRERMLH